MLVLNMNNAYFLKQNDTATEIELQVQNSDGTPFDLSTASRVEIVIGIDLGRVLVKTPTLLPSVGVLSFGLDEGDLLPVGDNNLEVHIYTDAGEKHVAPSRGYYKLRVQRAIDETQAEVTTYTLDYFLQEVRRATQRIEVIVEEGGQLVADLRPMKADLEALTVRANVAVASAEQAVIDADTAETKALASAQKANAAAENADTAASNAEITAEQAAATANAAATQASAAATNANEAKENADTAAAGANAASTDATGAADRANAAAELVEGWSGASPWSISTRYVKNNVVTFNGSTWQAKRDNQGMQPVEGDNWILLAQRGVDGKGAVSTVNGLGPDANGNVELEIVMNKEDIGLGNVDNTSDADKPVSTAQRAAIDEVQQQANNYTDVQVQGIAASGIPKLVSHEFLVTATTAGQRNFTFTDALYDASNDTVLVFFDGEALNKAEYTVTKGTNNAVTVQINDTGAIVGSVVRALIFRNVPVGPDGTINAAALKDGTVTRAKLHTDVTSYFAKQTDVTTLKNNENKVATKTALGKVKIGANMSVDAEGTISTSSQLINIIVREGITVDTPPTGFPTGITEYVETRTTEAIGWRNAMGRSSLGNGFRLIIRTEIPTASFWVGPYANAIQTLYYITSPGDGLGQLQAIYVRSAVYERDDAGNVVYRWGDLVQLPSLSGMDMEGPLVAYSNNEYLKRQTRNIIFKNTDPTVEELQDGDICFVYEDV